VTIIWWIARQTLRPDALRGGLIASEHLEDARLRPIGAPEFRSEKVAKN